MQYFTVTIKATVSGDDISSKKWAYYLELEKFVDDFNKNAPKGLKGLRQAARDAWGQIVAEQAFISNSRKGITLAVFFTTALLLIVTKNYVETFLSLTSIIAIAVTILSTIHLQGWNLGVAESCGTTVVFGFAVDYVVHLSGAYSRSKKKLREEKTTEAIR